VAASLGKGDSMRILRAPWHIITLQAYFEHRRREDIAAVMAIIREVSEGNKRAIAQLFGAGGQHGQG